MALRITIEMFSGRENPVVELAGKEADDAVARLKPAASVTRDQAATAAAPLLGYRGLRVEQIGARSRSLPRSFNVVEGAVFGEGVANRASDESFDQFFFGPKGPLRKVSPGIRKLLDQARPTAADARAALSLGPIIFPPAVVCACAPLYEPTWWNDGGQKQHNNNCYNYATNYRTDTFAQPGRAAGAMYTALTCASVGPAAVKDDLIDSPTANNKCPKEGHLVALVIWPGGDYHWYRKGRNGLWTHKPGSTAVTNLDNKGKVITDPRTADRGPYTTFCTFMVVMHGHVKIK